MVGTLVAILQQQQHQSAQMLAMMGERLERLEWERAASSQDTRPLLRHNPLQARAHLQELPIFLQRASYLLGLRSRRLPGKTGRGKYPEECRSCLQETAPIAKNRLHSEAAIRSMRLLSYLKQSISGWVRAEALLAHYSSTVQFGEAHGYEALRKLNLEFGLIEE